MFVKDPGATLDYRIDWSGRLVSGASIVTSGWSVEPADGLVLSGAGVDGLSTVVWAAGGAAGTVCRLTNHVLLSDGGADERTVVVRVEER